MFKANCIFALVFSFGLVGCGGMEPDLLADPGAGNKADDFRDWEDKPADIHTGYELTVGQPDFFTIQPAESHAFVVSVPAGSHQYSLRILHKQTTWNGRDIQAAWAVAEQGDIAGSIALLATQLGQCNEADPYKTCSDKADSLPGEYMGQLKGPAQVVILMQNVDDDSYEYSIQVNELDSMMSESQGVVLVGTTDYQEFYVEAGLSLVDSYIFPASIPYRGDTVQTNRDLPVYEEKSFPLIQPSNKVMGWVPAGTSLRVDWCYSLNETGEGGGVYCKAFW